MRREEIMKMSRRKRGMRPKKNNKRRMIVGVARTKHQKQKEKKNMQNAVQKVNLKTVVERIGNENHTRMKRMN